MRKSFVPQTGQMPWSAFFPFFMVMLCGLFISLFALHFTQYAVTKFVPLSETSSKSPYKRYRATFLLQIADI